MTVMQGTLADLDLASLALVTSLGRSSLRLEVTDHAGALVGYLVLKAGRVVSATAGGVHGRNAMQLIMRSTASARFRLVREPLDYVMSSALASVNELAELGRPRLARSSAESPVAEPYRSARRASKSATRVRMMQGRLDEFDLPTLLQVIGMGRSYVEIEVLSEDGARVGMVAIKAGNIVSARARDIDGIAAISELMNSRDCFEFAAFRIDADLGQVDALGSVAEIMLRSHTQASRPSMRTEAVSVTGAVPIMEGSLSEFDVATLLQTVSSGRQHCALEVCDEESVVGTIHVKSGVIVSAVAGSYTALPAIKHLVGLRAPHRFRLNRVTAAIGNQAPVGSISHLLLYLDPPSATPQPSSTDFEQDIVTARPLLPIPVPAIARGDDHVGRPIMPDLLPVMEGNLADFDFRTLLEALAVTRQYSYLQIFDRHNTQLGELRIKSGMLVSARAGIREGADALKFLLSVSKQCRFRVLTGVFNVDAIPLGSVYELLGMFASHSAPPPERASWFIRAVIPISFVFGGVIMFFVVRGGGTTATSSGDGPVVQMKAEPSPELGTKEAPHTPATPPAATPPAATPPAATPPAATLPAATPPAATPPAATPPAATPPVVQAPGTEGSNHQTGSVDPTTKPPEPNSIPDQPARTGMSIKTAQGALRRLGYDPGPLDNVYGRLTRIAILKFQGAHSLPKTGVLNDETWSAIVAALTGN